MIKTYFWQFHFSHQKAGLEILSRTVASEVSSPLTRFTSEFGMDQVVPRRSKDRQKNYKLKIILSQFNVAH